ncbi:MAG TPA: glycosyltransferase, partial [Roseiarcus sp.]|nr:glycosyltransferase [Roseiarcus sp.]
AGVHLPVESERGPLDDLARRRAWARHRRAINNARDCFPVDLVHLHGVDFGAYCPASGATLVTLHLPLSWYDPNSLRPARADLWLNGVSQSQTRSAPAEARLLPPIDNGVDVEALAARCGKRRFVLFLGRLCPEKGAHIAIAAARRASLPLIIAGQTFRYAEHERYFAEEIRPHLGPACRFAGPLNFARKRRFLTAARCVALPSLVPETSSLVAMEALACGTPVVAFRAGALADIVAHGRTGFLVETAEEMAEAMIEAAALDPDTCREEARARFSNRRMTAAYLDLYARIACKQALRA